jgi:hypothetical protein
LSWRAFVYSRLQSWNISLRGAAGERSYDFNTAFSPSHSFASVSSQDLSAADERMNRVLRLKSARITISA